jgi:hypothetical protein
MERVLTNEVARALQGLEFGEVIITVRDRQIIQIERIVRVRHIRRNKQ